MGQQQSQRKSVAVVLQGCCLVISFFLPSSSSTSISSFVFLNCHPDIGESDQNPFFRFLLFLLCLIQSLVHLYHNHHWQIQNHHWHVVREKSNSDSGWNSLHCFLVLCFFSCSNKWQFVIVVRQLNEEKAEAVCNPTIAMWGNSGASKEDPHCCRLLLFSFPFLPSSPSSNSELLPVNRNANEVCWVDVLGTRTFTSFAGWGCCCRKGMARGIGTVKCESKRVTKK